MSATRRVRLYFTAHQDIEIEVEGETLTSEDVERARQLLDRPHWQFEDHVP